MADGPVFAALTAKKFLASLKLLAKTTDKAPGLNKALSSVLRGLEAGLESVGSESATLKTLRGHPNNHILGATFYSQAPIRYGDYIAKMALFPVSPELTALNEKMVDVGHDLTPSGRPSATSSEPAAGPGNCVPNCAPT
jgi:hypothetical protein